MATKSSSIVCHKCGKPPRKRLVSANSVDCEGLKDGNTVCERCYAQAYKTKQSGVGAKTCRWLRLNPATGATQPTQCGALLGLKGKPIRYIRLLDNLLVDFKRTAYGVGSIAEANAIYVAAVGGMFYSRFSAKKLPYPLPVCEAHRKHFDRCLHESKSEIQDFSLHDVAVWSPCHADRMVAALEPTVTNATDMPDDPMVSTLGDNTGKGIADASRTSESSEDEAYLSDSEFSTGSSTSEDYGQEDLEVASDEARDCFPPQKLPAATPTTFRTPSILRKMQSPHTPYIYRTQRRDKSTRASPTSVSAAQQTPAKKYVAPSRGVAQHPSFITPQEPRLRFTPASQRLQPAPKRWAHHERYRFGSSKLRNVDEDHSLILCDPKALSVVASWTCMCRTQAERHILCARQLHLLHITCSSCMAAANVELSPPAPEMAQRVHASGVSFTDVQLLWTTMQMAHPCSKVVFHRVSPEFSAQVAALAEAGFERNLALLREVTNVCSDAELTDGLNFVLELDGTWNVSKVGSSCDGALFIHLPILNPAQTAEVLSHCPTMDTDPQYLKYIPDVLLLGTSHAYKPLPNDVAATRQSSRGAAGVFTTSKGLEYPVLLELAEKVFPKLPSRLQQHLRITLDGDGKAENAIFEVCKHWEPDAENLSAAGTVDSRPAASLLECLGHKLKNLRKALTESESSAVVDAFTFANPVLEVEYATATEQLLASMAAIGIVTTNADAADGAPAPAAVSSNMLLQGIALVDTLENLRGHDVARDNTEGFVFPGEVNPQVLDDIDALVEQTGPSSGAGSDDEEGEEEVVIVDDNPYIAIPADCVPPAKSAIQQLGVSCSCQLGCDTWRCRCSKEGLACNGGCKCRNCNNLQQAKKKVPIKVAKPSASGTKRPRKAIMATSASVDALSVDIHTSLYAGDAASSEVGTGMQTSLPAIQSEDRPLPTPTTNIGKAIAATGKSKKEGVTAAVRSLRGQIGYRVVGWVRHILRDKKPATAAEFERMLQDALQHWCGNHTSCGLDCPVRAGKYQSRLWSPTADVDMRASNAARVAKAPFIAELRPPTHPDVLQVEKNLHAKLCASIAMLVSSFDAIKCMSTTNRCEGFNRLVHKYIRKDRYNSVNHATLAKLAALDQMYGRGTGRAVLSFERTGELNAFDSISFKRLDHQQRRDQRSRNGYTTEAHRKRRAKMASNSRRDSVALSKLTKKGVGDKLPEYSESATERARMIRKVLEHEAVRVRIVSMDQAEEVLNKCSLRSLLQMAASANVTASNVRHTTN